jgi:hypothetical protein
MTIYPAVSNKQYVMMEVTYPTHRKQNMWSCEQFMINEDMHDGDSNEDDDVRISTS